MGWPHSIDVPALGLSGGMIFAWRLGVDFEFINPSRYSISITIQSNSVDSQCVLSHIHCTTDQVCKENFRNSLMHAGYETVCKENVLILSDFNAISCSSEKQGGRQFDFLPATDFIS